MVQEEFDKAGCEESSINQRLDKSLKGRRQISVLCVGGEHVDSMMLNGTSPTKVCKAAAHAAHLFAGGDSGFFPLWVIEEVLWPFVHDDRFGCTVMVSENGKRIDVFDDDSPPLSDEFGQSLITRFGAVREWMANDSCYTIDTRAPRRLGSAVLMRIGRWGDSETSDLLWVINTIAYAYCANRITEADILGASNKALDARILTIFILRHYFSWDCSDIARYFGFAPPAVLRNLDMANKLLEDSYLKERLDQIRSMLRIGSNPGQEVVSVAHLIAPIRETIEAAASAYEIEVYDLINGRWPQAVDARRLAAYAMKRYLMMSLEGIGSVLGCDAARARLLYDEGCKLCDNIDFASRVIEVRNHLDRI